MLDAKQTSKRSRNGCWTCKRRRRKCDETHPTCNTCRENGHLCEGYENRLRWGVGVASRGFLAGAAEPNLQTVPPRAKGRQRDLLKQAKQLALSRDDEAEASTDSRQGTVGSRVEGSHSPSAGSLSSPELALDPVSLRWMQKQTLFEECERLKLRLDEFQLTLNIVTMAKASHLISTNLDDDPLISYLPELCSRSETLYDVCVAFQSYMTHGANAIFYDFYSEALSKYRANLDHPSRTTDEALLHASLLLCTIGIFHGTPWTVHIHGMSRLLDDWTATSPANGAEDHFVHAIEVMGFFDLNRNVVGRQHSSLSAWRRYRAGQLISTIRPADSIQLVSGLPMSLIDLMAQDDGSLTEEQLWTWSGCDGTYLQCQLWEAYRFALMLSVRRHRQKQRIPNFSSLLASTKMSLPSDAALLTKALSAIDAVYNGKSKPDSAHSLVMNAMLFPLFHVSLETLSIQDRDGRHKLVTSWFERLLELDNGHNVRQAWDLVQKVSAQRQEGIVCEPEDIARSEGIETALF